MTPHTVPKRPMNGVALAGGGEEREIVLELGDLERGRASQRAVHRLEPVAGEPLVEIVEDLVEDLGDSRDLLIGREVELASGLCRSLRAALCTTDGRAPRGKRGETRTSGAGSAGTATPSRRSAPSSRSKKIMSTSRTNFAIGPEFQTSARMPEPRASVGTGAPYCCVQRI